MINQRNNTEYYKPHFINHIKIMIYLCSVIVLTFMLFCLQNPVAPNIPGLLPGQRVFIVHMPVPGYR